MATSLLYEIALGWVPGIGHQTTKILISYCGSAEAVFKTSRSKLIKIPGVGQHLASAILSFSDFSKAEAEIEKAQKHGVQILFYTHSSYPERLKQLADAPTLLYYKGNTNLNAEKIISIVGTRSNTAYGKEITEKIVRELAPYKPIILSGLAYGIDIIAHRAALEAGLETIAVLGSGIDVIYPSAHKDIASRMTRQGGLLSEYSFGTKPDAHHFPARNRIVAGLSDAVLVIEAAEKGGALITAEIANSYNVEVLAVPGNVDNKFSEGCNTLIKQHKAHMCTCAEDIANLLNWSNNTNTTLVNNSSRKKNLPTDLLTEEEKKIVELLISADSLHIDELSWKSQIAVNRLSSILLNLEFNGWIKSLPGKKFKIIH
ncbi:MAG: DNA-processing protein DprA [Cytophagaceae bacterium]|nr:DNA-processing protein DprA [Cytophagaceae bacterium]MDW8457249.1 DNA-processing protein DprA [Cytophagaceae bacterium]